MYQISYRRGSRLCPLRDGQSPELLGSGKSVPFSTLPAQQALPAYPWNYTDGRRKQDDTTLVTDAIEPQRPKGPVSCPWNGHEKTVPPENGSNKPLVMGAAGGIVLSPSSSPFRADFLGCPELDDVGVDIDSTSLTETRAGQSTRNQSEAEMRDELVVVYFL